jgi:hypothetical protein
VLIALLGIAACGDEPAPGPEPIACEPPAGTWVEADGRINGDILSLAILDDRTVLAGTTFGIVALDPLTKQWGPRVDFAAPVTSIARDPADPARLLATSQGIHESIDGGASWHPVLADPAVGVVAFAPSQPSRAYALLGTRALRSDDGGRTWTEVSVDLPSDPHGLVVMTSDADAVYATWMGSITATGARSDDGGVSWDNSMGFFHVAVGAGTTIYGGNAMGTTRSDDGGGTWTWLGTTAEAYAIAADPGPPEIVYAASRGLVKASTDRGETWSTWIDFAPIGWPDTMVVGPDGGLYVGATRGSAVLLLGDGGDEAHWYGGGISGAGRRLAPSQDGLLYVTTTDGVFLSGHAGITWGTIAPEIQVAPTTTPTVLVAPSDSAAMYLHFEQEIGAGTVVRTEDGGMTWLGVPAYNRVPAAVDPVSPLVIYSIVDGELDSTIIPDVFTTPLDVGPGRVTGVFADRDQDDALLVAAGERVVRMTDFGATTDVLFDPDRDLEGSPDLGTIEGIFNTGDGELLISYDSGRFVRGDADGAWEAFAPAIDADLDAAPMTQLTSDPTAALGLFGLSGGRVYRSPDLGGTWCGVDGSIGEVTGIATLGGLSLTLVASTDSRLYRIAIE